MNAIQVMPSEIESLHVAVAEMRSHFDAIIHDTIIPRMDRLETKVDAVNIQAQATNGRLRAVELWQARWEGMKAGAGGSWQVLIAAGGIAIAIISLVLTKA